MHDILTYPSGDLPKSKVRALEFIKGGWSGQGFILGPWSFGLVCVFLPISVFFYFLFARLRLRACLFGERRDLWLKVFAARAKFPD